MRFSERRLKSDRSLRTQQTTTIPSSGSAPRPNCFTPRCSRLKSGVGAIIARKGECLHVGQLPQSLLHEHPPPRSLSRPAFSLSRQIKAATAGVTSKEEIRKAIQVRTAMQNFCFASMSQVHSQIFAATCSGTTDCGNLGNDHRKHCAERSIGEGQMGNE